MCGARGGDSGGGGGCSATTGDRGGGSRAEAAASDDSRRNPAGLQALVPYSGPRHRSRACRTRLAPRRLVAVDLRPQLRQVPVPDRGLLGSTEGLMCRCMAHNRLNICIQVTVGSDRLRVYLSAGKINQSILQGKEQQKEIMKTVLLVPEIHHRPHGPQDRCLKKPWVPGIHHRPHGSQD